MSAREAADEGPAGGAGGVSTPRADAGTPRADANEPEKRELKREEPEAGAAGAGPAPGPVAGAGAGPAPGLVVRVLVVEDDKVNRTIVSSLLRGCGYDVVCAVDGREAIKLLREENASSIYSLVLCDIMMPHIDGKGVLTFIRSTKALENLPVVMMSALEQTPTVFDCIKRGADDYILKPVTRKEVKYLWAHVWRRKQRSQEQQADGAGGRAGDAGAAGPAGDAGGRGPDGAQERADDADGAAKRRRDDAFVLRAEKGPGDVRTPGDMREYCERQILKYQRVIKLIEENPDAVMKK